MPRRYATNLSKFCKKLASNFLNFINDFFMIEMIFQAFSKFCKDLPSNLAIIYQSCKQLPSLIKSRLSKRHARIFFGLVSSLAVIAVGVTMLISSLPIVLSLLLWTVLSVGFCFCVLPHIIGNTTTIEAMPLLDEDCSTLRITDVLDPTSFDLSSAGNNPPPLDQPVVREQSQRAGLNDQGNVVERIALSEIVVNATVGQDRVMGIIAP